MRKWIAAALFAWAPIGAVAQSDLSMGQVQSPVLTIDANRLFAETRYGQEIDADLRARSEVLRVENERLAAELTAEERSLTERRPTMEAEVFRAEADAFDQRVQSIRAEQDAKQRELEEAVTRSREDFLDAVKPVLARLMIDSGAAVILERRDVFLSVGLVDITDEAVAAIDAQMGDGNGAEVTPGQLPPAEEAPPASENASPLASDPVASPAAEGEPQASDASSEPPADAPGD